ncbi:MAG: hypothetical protein WCH62_08460 [Candidatus Omnitrophota bacterium]
MTTENAAQYAEVKNTNEKEETGLQKLADKYEEDRIGQGKVAKGATRFLNKFGVMDNIIGGPDKTLSPYDHRTQAEITSAEQEGQQTAINTLQSDPRSAPGATEIPVETLTNKSQAADIINEAVKVDMAPEQVEQQKANNNLIKKK